MLALQILVDGFAISALYGLGAVGFALIFGVSGVLNLAHGSILVLAAMTAWLVASQTGMGLGLAVAAGSAAGCIASFATFLLVVRPIQRSRALPTAEKEVFILTATLLWGIMIQEAIAYFFTDNPKGVPPLIAGVSHIAGVRVPNNQILVTPVCWLAIGLLWLLVNRTKIGQTLLAASMNLRGLILLGFDPSRIFLLAWTVYGILAGIAGVLLATFIGASSAQVGTLTASAFTIVVLGGLGSVGGALIAAYLVGYLETITAYLLSPTLRTIPALILLVLVVYARPRGLLGRH